MRRVVDTYLQLDELEPPGGRIDLPTHVDAGPLRPFDPGAISLELRHRIAQHCVCDEVGYSGLQDVASVWNEADPVQKVYRALAKDAAVAIRRGLALRPFELVTLRLR